MKASLEERVLEVLGKEGAAALKPKALARRLGVSAADYTDFRRLLKRLVKRGKIEPGRGKALRPATPHSELVGVFRGIRAGGGFVRPRPGQGTEVGDVYIRPENALDAASGDVVLVRLSRKIPSPALKGRRGVILEVLERASNHFVGVYHVSEGEGLVRVDGGVFHEPIYVGDPGAKGARDGDKVVFEMLRFPSPEMTGEGVITEVLGPRGEPGVDLISVIRQFHLPDEFSEDALAEARQQARIHEEEKVPGDRLDLTGETIVTIDPVDARDFDDAISLARDDKGFWRLGVHIADVATFVPEGSALDQEARSRATSVYLPGRVIPMLPELISNGLASLQERRVRLTKTVHIEFDPEGRITAVEFANSAIRVTKRLTYEQAMAALTEPAKFHGKLSAKVLALLGRMRELAALLRGRRRRRGMLELSMPEAELEYDEQGRVTGAHYTVDDESHRIIEEFMVTANEAVATRLKDGGFAFLRRIHEIPDPLKLKSFAGFVRSLGLKLDDYRSRFELQRILSEVAPTTKRHAVHYALLRSLREAVYSPEDEGHFALASDCYCHFTSPIRRYPDLTVHRMLDQLVRTGKAAFDHAVLVGLGEHCSYTERRAEKAERELVKVKLLEYLRHHTGEEWEMVITGVEEFGFFAEGTEFPAEGLVHIRSLTDDYYALDRATHSLVGKRAGRRFRLGDKVRCLLWRVDQEHRQLDLRLAATGPSRRAAPPRQPKRRR